MVATIADIVNEVAQSLNWLLLRVDSAVLSAGDVAMVRGLVDQADFVCTQTVAKFSASTAFSDLGHRGGRQYGWRSLRCGHPGLCHPNAEPQGCGGRDRCCRFPHCARPARWSEIHHIRERANQGTHELPSLVLLCTYHHREVHRRGIGLSWDGPALVATLPSGVMLHGPPHPATQPAL